MDHVLDEAGDDAPPQFMNHALRSSPGHPASISSSSAATSGTLAQPVELEQAGAQPVIDVMGNRCLAGKGKESRSSITGDGE